LIKERKLFEKVELLEMLDQVSLALDHNIDGYLIGGLAMILHGAKASTKDIDIIFKDESNAKMFVTALSKCNFHLETNIPKEYLQLNTHTIMVNDKNHQFDIFIKQVCSKLILTEEMIARSKVIYDLNNLKLHGLSLEDIYLFKGITEREHDIQDMYTIKSAGIDDSIVEKELLKQPDSWKWVPSFYFSLIELKENYNTESKSLKSLKDEVVIDRVICSIMVLAETNQYTITDIENLLNDDDKEMLPRIIKKMETMKLIQIKEERVTIL